MDRYYFHRKNEGVYFHLKKYDYLYKMDRIRENIIYDEYKITKEKMIDFLDLVFSQYAKIKIENLKLKEEIKTLKKDYAFREESPS